MRRDLSTLSLSMYILMLGTCMTLCQLHAFNSDYTSCILEYMQAEFEDQLSSRCWPQQAERKATCPKQQYIPSTYMHRFIGHTLQLIINVRSYKDCCWRFIAFPQLGVYTCTGI